MAAACAGATSSTSSSNFIIRKCVPDDIAQIVDIYNYYITKPGDLTTFEEVEITESEILDRYHHTLSKNMPYIVCVDESNNTIVGYGYGSMYGPRVSYRYSCEDSVYLHHEYVGKGIGSMLLKQLLIELKANGMKQVPEIIYTH